MNIFCKCLMSSKVWLLLLLRTFGGRVLVLCVNLISSAPLIFCTTKPCFLE
ncbi:hypothetical protein BAZSYMB_SCAFFOLD00080_2 [Bathymodiolus azoricus thioautotrophic gill symbiont]|uniref:Uncharacterized protein n=1 Tax=Bathymodiolus azoricus thioautotrophic gill symbiont TaxID=235205 RepID=A0A1H6LFX0_9GAMM|nr:hypothetical protein BAZSYMB_SCAFFOLD00080_2 [Bathymodiolus azoricus thioautotrophic gill symbiont]